ETGREVTQGNPQPDLGFGHHAVDGDALLQLVILYQRQMVVTWRLHLWIPTNLVLIQTSESVEKSLQHVAHYAVTLEAQFTHGLEEQALLGITGRPVCHLEQRIVGTLEQGLQSQFELR